jgi:type IV pilus assembly protein PilB
MTFPANPLKPAGGASFSEGEARPFLGTILVRKGWVTPERLEAALADARATRRRLGEVLLQRGWLFENELAHALAEQSGLEYLDLVARGVDPMAAALLPADFARHFFVVPVRVQVDGRVLVAAAEPEDADIDVLETILQRPVVLGVAERTAIRTAWRHVFP